MTIAAIPRSRLSGGTDELAVLTGLMRHPEANAGRLVLVTGAWGSGKSFVLRALQARAAEMGMPTWWMDGDGGWAGPFLAEGGRADVAASGTSEASGAVGHAVRLVLVDDLQWLTHSGLDALEDLLQGPNRGRHLVVAALLEGDPGAVRGRLARMTSGARRLRLAGLSTHAIHRLLQDRAGVAADWSLAVACAEATNHNPLFVSEIISRLDLGVPPTVDTIAGARRQALVHRIRSLLDAQPRAVSTLAEALSVLDGGGSLPTAAAMAGLAPVEAARVVQRLQQLGVLRPGPELALSPPVLGALVQDGMPADRLESLHDRAAHRLSAEGGDPEAVARHILRAAPRRARWPRARLKEASRAAVERKAPRTAARYLRHALARAEPGSRAHTCLLVELAVVEQSFDMESAIRHLAQAVPQWSERPDRRARCLERFSPLCLSGAPPQVRQTLQDTVAALGDPDLLPARRRDRALRIRARWLCATIGKASGVSGTPGVAEEPAAPEESGTSEKPATPGAADLPETADAGNRPTVGPTTGAGTRTPGESALTAALLYRATLMAARPAAGIAVSAEHLLRAEPTPPSPDEEAFLLYPVLVYAGRSRLLRDLGYAGRVGYHGTGTDAASPRTERLTQAAFRAGADALVALSEGFLGDAVDAAEYAKELGGVGWKDHGRDLAFALARIAVESRHTGLCTFFLDSAEASQEHPWRAAAFHLVCGYREIRRGSCTAALQHFRNCGNALADAGAGNPEFHIWRGMVLACLIRLERHTEARAVAEEGYQLARAWGTPLAMGVALRNLGWCSEHGRRTELFERAIALLRTSGNRLELAKAHYSLARQLSSPRAAREHLNLGRDLAEECGVVWEREWTGPVNFALRRARPKPPRLTSAEEEVARLAAGGDANPDIARQVKVTVRTVERRLARVYAKLGIEGRRALPEALNSRAVSSRRSDDQLAMKSGETRGGHKPGVSTPMW